MTSISTSSSSSAAHGSGVTTNPPTLGSFGSPLMWVLGGLTLLMLSAVALVAGTAAPQYGINRILAGAIAVASVLAVSGLIAAVHAWANTRRTKLNGTVW